MVESNLYSYQSKKLSLGIQNDCVKMQGFEFNKKSPITDNGSSTVWRSRVAVGTRKSDTFLVIIG